MFSPPKKFYHKKVLTKPSLCGILIIPPNGGENKTPKRRKMQMKNQYLADISRTGLHSFNIKTPNIEIVAEITIHRPVSIDEVNDLFMCGLDVLVLAEEHGHE